MGITDAIKAASEPVTKLIEAVSHAIGKAYEPRHIRKMAEAKAYEMRLISEELRNNSDLPIIYNGSQTMIDTSDYDSLRQRAGARLAFQEIQKQENIESIVDQACEEAEGKTLETEETVNPDWMNRFIGHAGEVSDEDMQKLWARVLAGEVIHPKSYSLKTLDCLRNMTADDAELFRKICPYIIQGRFISNESGIIEKYGVTYSDILQLDECGLLNSSGLISLDATLGQDPIIILDFGSYILTGTCNEGGTQQISVGQYPLTRAGKELYRIVQNSNPSTKYMNEIIELVKQNANRSSISLHRILFREGTKVHYDRTDIVQIPSEDEVG